MYQAENADRKLPGQLGKDEFLRILVTQLKYQDPLSPMEDKEFIAQLAQFSALEQMQNLSSEFSSMKALSLVGKMVYAEKRIGNSPDIVTVLGRVERVSIFDGNVYLHVNGQDIRMDDIVTVYSDEEADMPDGSIKEVVNDG
jgi:flagellar basal-body rod modification protein FlgD